MPLILSKLKTFKWTVNYQFANPDEPDTYIELNFIGVFKRLPQSELEEIQKQLDIAEKNPEKAISPLVYAKKMLVGWEDVTEEDSEGNQIPAKFTDKKKEELLEMPMMPIAIIQAIYKGIVPQKTKN